MIAIDVTKNQNDSLKHYASKYYDPVKAHEYYEEHKELVGRHGTANLNDEGKIAWKSVKKNITEEKKAKNKQISQDYKNTVATYRARAQETRERITNKLRERLSEISDDVARKKMALDVKNKIEMARIGTVAGERRDSIKNQTSSKIEELKKSIANTNNDATKSRLMDTIERAQDSQSHDLLKTTDDEVNKKQSTNEEIKNQHREITDNAAANKQKVKEEAASEKEQVRNTLNESIANARSEMLNKKSSLKTTYDAIFDQEYSKISNDMGKGGKSMINSEMAEKANKAAEQRRKEIRERWKKRQGG